MTTSIDPSDGLNHIEQWLSEAGFSFTIVDACPDGACEVCDPKPLSAAA